MNPDEDVEKEGMCIVDCFTVLVEKERVSLFKGR